MFTYDGLNIDLKLALTAVPEPSPCIRSFKSHRRGLQSAAAIVQAFPSLK
ncbi:MAG: hypothetical protein H0X40_00590 [Chthoniobacterales bacterium]|nr:hypothetical protein [Chthoniobacterales bacterium]